MHLDSDHEEENEDGGDGFGNSDSKQLTEGERVQRRFRVVFVIEQSDVEELAYFASCATG